MIFYSIVFSFTGLVAAALLLRLIAYLLQLWAYNNHRRRFFDGKPKAWYPPIKKPTFFNIKNTMQ